MWSKIKKVILFLVIGAVLVGGYTVLMKKPADKASLVTSTTPTETAATTNSATTTTGDKKLGQDFLTLLFSVKSINLDNGVFESPTFASLKDSSIILVPDGTEGRPNPFAPIGTEDKFTAADQAALISLGQEGAEEEEVVPEPPKTQTPTTPKKKPN